LSAVTFEVCSSVEAVSPQETASVESAIAAHITNLFISKNCSIFYFEVANVWGVELVFSAVFNFVNNPVFIVKNHMRFKIRFHRKQLINNYP
jgi:hypothetical protein